MSKSDTKMIIRCGLSETVIDLNDDSMGWPLASITKGGMMVEQTWLKRRLGTIVNGVFVSSRMMKIDTADYFETLSDGDQIWTFNSPDWVWGMSCGRKGYAIVRNGKLEDFAVTEIN